MKGKDCVAFVFLQKPEKYRVIYKRAVDIMKMYNIRTDFFYFSYQAQRRNDRKITVKSGDFSEEVMNISGKEITDFEKTVFAIGSKAVKYVGLIPF